jgi:transcriptional regulator with XRE-family HTH domain
MNRGEGINTILAGVNAPRLILLLLERGLSQAEIARRIGSTPRTVSRWACGHAVPDRKYSAMLAKLERDTR